jgi:hypothetical protein
MTLPMNIRKYIALALIPLATAVLPYRAVADGTSLIKSIISPIVTAPVPAAIASPTPVPPPAPGQQWTVQIGAYSNSEDAVSQLTAYAHNESDLVGSAGQIVTPTQMPDGRTAYRARFGPFTQSNARALCGKLKQRGYACFVADQAAHDEDGNTAGTNPAAPRTLSVAQLKAVGSDELSNMRGGFFTASGAKFDFGATVQTLVNGQMALQSTIQWTPSGTAVQQITGSVPNSVPLSNADLAQILGNAISAIAASGIQINSPSGSTQVIANVASGQVQNLLINAASNQNITQNTNVTLTIHNFADWQQQLSQNATAWRLTNEVSAASSLTGGP